MTYVSVLPIYLSDEYAGLAGIVFSTATIGIWYFAYGNSAHVISGNIIVVVTPYGGVGETPNLANKNKKLIRR